MNRCLFLLLISLIFIPTAFADAADVIDVAKPDTRIIVLTDIENEPDDAMSLVRFLLYANQWDVEGLVATTSVHQRKQIASWRIREILDAYEKVQPNLLLHEPGYPSADYLRSVTCEGWPDYGMNAVGDAMDSEGSELIINSLKKDDPRPLWVLVWGGPNCLAQALWKIKNTCGPEEALRLIGKLRIYAISDQDNSGPWIRENFPDLFYIVSPGWNHYGGYHYATWSGISGDKFHGRFSGADFDLVDNPWLDRNIRCKGPLGEQYPQIKYLMEGDSPTFLYLIENGLGNSLHPDWGSWGGRYEFYLPHTQRWFLKPETRPIWTNAIDEVLGNDGSWHTSNHATIWRWREDFQNDFAARMDWSVKPYSEANHPPVVETNGSRFVDASPGDTVPLKVIALDPDKDNLSYDWFYYPEPGSFTMTTTRSGNPLKIFDADKSEAYFIVPKNGNKGTMHFIVAVRDDGVPSLARYARIIVTVK